MSLKDGAEEQPTTTVTAAAHPPATVAASPPELPFTVFDRRQQWLIIAIVSTAATCETRALTG